MAEAGAASAPTVKMVTARRRIDTEVLPCQDLESADDVVEGACCGDPARGTSRLGVSLSNLVNNTRRSSRGSHPGDPQRQRAGSEMRSPPWFPPAMRVPLTLAISLPRVTPLSS